MEKTRFMVKSRTAEYPAVRVSWADFWSKARSCCALRYKAVHFRLMDINCLFYLGSTGSLLIFFHKSIPFWPSLTAGHAVACGGILEIIRLNSQHPESRSLNVLRTFYPVPVFLFAWLELGWLVPMLFGSYWFTEILVQWDKLLFGVHPTVWVQRFYHNVWLNELMNFFYVGYYTFFVVIPLFLYASGQKREARAVLSIATFVYFSNFFLFFIFPACSPPFVPVIRELHTIPQTGFAFVNIHHFVQSNGGIPGGCFPSSHVAGAFAWVLCAFRYKRKLGWVLMPIAAGVFFATVYNGVHHAVDPIIGVVWGILMFRIALKWVQIRGEDPAHGVAP